MVFFVLPKKTSQNQPDILEELGLERDCMKKPIIVG